jgi:hypothetical protein
MFSIPVEYYPAKWSFDALKISGDIAYYDISGSFEATRKTLYFAGKLSANLITISVAIGWIFIISKYVDTLHKALITSLFLVPLFLFNLLWPAKETIVMLLSLLLVLLWTKFRINLLATIVISYLVYGLFFRTYYLLILLVFIIFNVMNFPVIYKKNSIDLFGTIIDSSSTGVFYKIFIVLVFIFAMPESFYISSQGQRDVSNAYAILEGSLNMTAFNNLNDVGRGFDFIVNYLWSALNLLFPFVIGFTVNQFLLFAFNVVTFIAIYRIFKFKISNVFVYLYCSHVAVLFLFEPDQGSYLRHILSVSIYLVPLLGIGAINNLGAKRL